MKPYSAGKFINVKFRVTRGTEGSVCHFTLADILLDNILLLNPQEYQPIIDHVKRMLVCYIHEVAKMDQEIASAIHK